MTPVVPSDWLYDACDALWLVRMSLWCHGIGWMTPLLPCEWLDDAFAAL
jgi:hypothetical protein